MSEAFKWDYQKVLVTQVRYSHVYSIPLPTHHSTAFLSDSDNSQNSRTGLLHQNRCVRSGGSGRQQFGGRSVRPMRGVHKRIDLHRASGQRIADFNENNQLLLLRNIPLCHSHTECDQGRRAGHELVADNFEVDETQNDLQATESLWTDRKRHLAGISSVKRCAATDIQISHSISADGEQDVGGYFA